MKASCSRRERRCTGGSYFRSRIHRTWRQIGHEARKAGLEGEAAGLLMGIRRCLETQGIQSGLGWGPTHISHGLTRVLSPTLECGSELQLFNTGTGPLSQTPQWRAWGQWAAWLCTSLHPLQNVKCRAGSSSSRCLGLYLQHSKSLPFTGDAKCI